MTCANPKCRGRQGSRTSLASRQAACKKFGRHHASTLAATNPAPLLCASPGASLLFLTAQRVLASRPAARNRCCASPGPSPPPLPLLWRRSRRLPDLLTPPPLAAPVQPFPIAMGSIDALLNALPGHFGSVAPTAAAAEEANKMAARLDDQVVGDRSTRTLTASLDR